MEIGTKGIDTHCTDGSGFCSCGQDTYLCQVCARELCGAQLPPAWRPDLTGHTSAGNICPKCLADKLAAKLAATPLGKLAAALGQRITEAQLSKQDAFGSERLAHWQGVIAGLEMARMDVRKAMAEAR
jgi:hypothetical protein